MSSDREIDRRPLLDDERYLIEQATNRPWSDTLRAAMTAHVTRRGGHVDRYSTCGDMADWLAMVARADHV